MVKRIPKSKVVKGNKRVLPANHPLTSFYDPNAYTSEEVETPYEYIPKSIPTSAALFGSPATNLIVDQPEKELETNLKAAVVDRPDVPQPADIESVEYVKYFDPVSKIEKAKAIIKIRNSSINKRNVSGVDARIYQPRGI